MVRVSASRGILAVAGATALLLSGCALIDEYSKPNPDALSVDKSGTRADVDEAVERSPKPKATATPDKPSAATVTRVGSAIRVNWYPPQDTGGGVVKYQARITEGNGYSYGAWKDTYKKTKTTFTGTSGTSTYNIQVRSVNRRGNSSPLTVKALRISSPRPAQQYDFRVPNINLG
ncbi:MAG: fibronectin type III domain-containing protein [Actinobacteria bacterium]|nr:fibronectin type III domain-containing protein [Actinomycetota bacterium]